MRVRASSVAMTLALCAAVGLVACSGGGASSGHATASASASGASLSCTFHERPDETDTTMVSVSVTCFVTGAAASETSFKIKHFVTGADGQGMAEDAGCGGSLTNGAGICDVTFLELASKAEPGTVSGMLLPSNAPLGPVKPGIIP